MKKCDTGKIDPNTHVRILDFLNAAQKPEQLMTLPKNEILFDEEHLLKGPNLHERLEEAEGGKGKIKLLDKKIAKLLFDERCRKNPIQGFTHIDQIQDIIGIKIFPNIFDILLIHFGRATYGDWRDAGRVIKNGETIGVAHAAMLCNGSVLFIEAACRDPERKSETPLYDPVTENITFPAPPQVGAEYENLYCCGSVFLSDGKLLAVGGGGESEDTDVPDLAWIFDSNAGTWDFTRDKNNLDPNTNRTELIKGRWYPTLVNLGDGRILIASGRSGPGQTPRLTPVSTMEIYSESSGRFMDVTTQNDKTFPALYPGLHLLPGGEVFFSGTGWRGNIEQSAYIDLFAAGVPDWNDVGVVDRVDGMSVQILSPDYPFVRVMVIGGRIPGKSTSYQTINLSTLSPSWQPDTLLPIASGEASITERTNVNVVVLPDNTVFVSGGTSTNQPCWLYNPASGGSWSQMANLPTQRAYHSLALLLPSGEVLTSGAVGGSADRNLIEIYRPPYMFNSNGTLRSSAQRPQITSVPEHPAKIHHGATFEISTPQADQIDKVVLVRPMAVTHQTDSEQRVIHLSFSKSGANKLNATVPNGWHPHAMAPAGCYMLFIINADGIPSMAKFVLIH
jgi:Galactose oxidase-like, Early set domain